jgi:hypothetical protein
LGSPQDQGNFVAGFARIQVHRQQITLNSGESSYENKWRFHEVRAEAEIAGQTVSTGTTELVAEIGETPTFPIFPVEGKLSPHLSTC